MTDNFEVNITKRKKLLEINNDMVYNIYYLIQGRIYNKNKTKYKKFKFVLFYDIWDLLEYYEEYDKITKDMEKDFINDLIYGYTQYINSYEDVNYFYELCDDTIKNYNKII